MKFLTGTGEGGKSARLGLDQEAASQRNDAPVSVRESGLKAGGYRIT